jgi:hypothetical protein
LILVYYFNWNDTFHTDVKKKNKEKEIIAEEVSDKSSEEGGEEEEDDDDDDDGDKDDNNDKLGVIKPISELFRHYTKSEIVDWLVKNPDVLQAANKMNESSESEVSTKSIW